MSQMKLYIMRHGPAEDCAPSGRDADRRLTPEGRDRTLAVAQAMCDEGERPNIIFTSPRVRALETAELVAELANRASMTQLGATPCLVEIRRELGMGVDQLPLLIELLRAGRNRVMIVGHEPDLSSLVTSLVGPKLSSSGMAKAMVVGLKLTSDTDVAGLEFRATFRFVVEPKALHWRRT